MNWERTDGGGYSDKDQRVPWQTIIEWQVEMFFYSCYLYYVNDTPKLSDESFDNIIDILEANYDILPERITHVCSPRQIKANAHLFAHDLSDIEKQNALLWKDDRL